MKQIKLRKRSDFYFHYPLYVYVDGKKLGCIHGSEKLLLDVPSNSQVLTISESAFQKGRSVNLSTADMEEMFLLRQNKVFKYLGSLIFLLFILFLVELFTWNELLKNMLIGIISFILVGIILIFSLGKRCWIIVEKQESFDENKVRKEG